jgi:uncharacterized membrane protein
VGGGEQAKSREASAAAEQAREVSEQPDLRASVLAAGLIGFAMMAAIDEVVFHQLLAWHHFYDRSTTDTALVSDGLLHAAELVGLVAGFFWFSDLRRRRALVPRAAWGGFLVGAGLFQLWDGLVDHKLLEFHQVRYGVDLLPYDIAWNVPGLAMLTLGAWITGRAGPVSTANHKH